MKKLTLATAALASAAALVPAGVSAAIVTNTYAIQASNFRFVAGNSSAGPSPVTSVNAQFTVTFDTTVSSGGPLLNDLGLPAPYGVGLNYTYQSGIDRLNISQTPSSTINQGPFPSGGIYVSIQGASTATPSFINASGTGPFLVTNTAGTAQYNATNASVSIVPAETPAVPEPATWGMMLLGFGLAGASMRRRRSTTTVTYA